MSKTYEEGYRDGFAAACAAAQLAIESLRTNVPIASPESYTLDMNMTIDELNLPSRAYNRLRIYGLVTVAKIYEYHANGYGLARMLYFGKVSYDALNEELVAKGFPKLAKYRG